MGSRLALPSSLALLVLLTPAAASAAPTVSDFAAGTDATGISQGSDGRIWFTGPRNPGQVGSISTDGVFGPYAIGLAHDAKPLGIARGPGGVWFTENGKDKISRVTPTGTVTEFDVGEDGEPVGITAGPGGSMWYTAQKDEGAVASISPSGTVREYTAGLTPKGDPQGIALGVDDNLYFTLPGTRRLGRVTQAGKITELGAGTLRGTPREITAGPDGNLWFTEDGAFPAVGRLTPNGAITEFSAGLATVAAPTSITAGADGNLYFTDKGRDTVGQVTPGGTIIQYGAALPAGADPSGITTGSDGRLWVADRGRWRVVRLSVAPGAAGTTVTGVDRDSAAVASTVTPNSEATTSHFEWGTTTAYGQATGDVNAGSDPSPSSATTSLTGLTAGTTYHVRLVAANATGTTYGADSTFTTAAADQPAPASPAASATPAAPAAPGSAPTPKQTPDPTPTLGKEAVASAVRGVIRFRVPGAKQSELLDGDSTIPSGSVIDASQGTLELESALDKRGRTQTARFAGTTFRVNLSRRDRGVVDVYLTAKPTGCRPEGALSRAVRLAKSRSRSRRPVRLWSKDRKGKYRTHGRNSVATVRGTQWSTSETCSGTLTRVMQGAVSVRDQRTGKRVLVRAGHTFLARSKKA